MLNQIGFLEILLFVVIPVVYIIGIPMMFIGIRREIRKIDRSEYRTYFSTQFFWFTLWVGVGLAYLTLSDVFFLPPAAWSFNPYVLGVALLLWLTGAWGLYYFTGRLWPTK